LLGSNAFALLLNLGLIVFFNLNPCLFGLIRQILSCLSLFSFAQALCFGLFLKKQLLRVFLLLNTCKISLSSKFSFLLLNSNTFHLFFFCLNPCLFGLLRKILSYLCFFRLFQTFSLGFLFQPQFFLLLGLL
jgi:hypothetical protein